MDEPIAESSANAPPARQVPPSDAEVVTLAGPGPRPRRRWLLWLGLAPVVLMLLLIVAWAIDTSLGGVPRNVRLGTADVGGLSEDELAARVANLAKRFADRPVEIVSGEHTYTTTAGAIGLLVDEERTAASTLDAGQDGLLLLRPLGWAWSFLTPRTADLRFQVSDEQVSTTIVELEGDERTPPTEPSIELVDGTFHVVAGEDGRGIDPSRLADALPEAAAAAEGAVIRVVVERGPIPPLGSVGEARAAASEAERLVSRPIEIQTEAGPRTIEPDELRRWVALESTPDGDVVVTLDPIEVAEGLRAAYAGIDGSPVDASFTLSGGVPVIRPDRPGLICCAAGADEAIDAALHDGRRTITLELVEGPANFTVEDAQAWGITQAVGGNHAWRNGAPTTAGPGFTTYHSAGGARVTNIHRIADLVRGAVVPPGGSFSINDHVGKRTAAKGFVAAGAIRDGEHVDEIGGGISQFATTMFNAAYFAGLDIEEYQAHSEYFDRYPLGREATMGFPAPDLVISNNTPYGILIWTSYTSTSLTVTLYSTPHATAEQTGITEGRSGRCRVVTTTRTRTFPDGHTEQDKFRARYRPGEGQSC